VDQQALAEYWYRAVREVRYGVPGEVLTDNGRQFTGRYTRPQPVEVLFERVCRENGIVLRHGKPRSPTTTGKIERFHKSLRAELLDHVSPFESLEAAQAAIDGWVHAYNHQRPHQAWTWQRPLAGSARTAWPAASPSRRRPPRTTKLPCPGRRWPWSAATNSLVSAVAAQEAHPCARPAG
jgi:transposase InsO family protein